MLVIKMNKKIIILLFLLPFFISAQVISDAQQWTNFSVNKKINDFEFSLGEEFRFDENITHLGKFFTEVGAEYKIKKGLYIGANYRFIRENDYETSNYNLAHRIDIGVGYKLKLSKLKLDFKTKFQVKSSLPEENSPTFNRTKVTTNYSINEKLTPFVSYEVFYQFNDQHIINKTRLSIGTKWAINDENSLKLYYLFDNKFNVKKLKYNHIFGVSYSIDI